MATNFNDAILTELSKRFGSEVAGRFKDRGFLKSAKSFFGTEENFQKSVRQIELSRSGDLGKQIIESKLFERILDATTNDKPLLLVVSSSDEHRAAKIMMDRFKDVINTDNVVVKRLPKTTKDGFISAVSEFTKDKNLSNEDEFDIVAVGCGAQRDMVVNSALSYMRSQKARMTFLGDIDKPAMNDVSARFGDVVLSSGQVLAETLSQVVSSYSEDVLSEGDKVEFQKQLSKLAKLSNHMSHNAVPLEFRASTNDELALMSELQRSFSFAGNVGWMMENGDASSLHAAFDYDGLSGEKLDSLNRALESNNVNKYELFESIDDVKLANLTAGLMLKHVEQLSSYGYESGDLNLFTRIISDELENLDTSSPEYLELSKGNNLLKLRDVVTDFKTRANLTKCQVNALSRMQEVILDAKLANIRVRNTIRNSTLLRDRVDGCVKITEVNDALYSIVSPEYLAGMTGGFVDGVSMMMSSDKDNIANVYVRGDIEVLEAVRDDLENSDIEGIRGGIQSISKNSDSESPLFNTKDIDLMVAQYRKAAEKKAELKNSNGDAPVIVVEPDTLGDALSIMNHLKVGHTNGIDPDIHFRIPVKHRIRVTDSFGSQQFLTLSEIAEQKYNFETFECVYQTNDGKDKSIYLDKSDLSAMYSEVGKKRFYGMLKTKFSPNALNGNLAIVGYDPNYAIKYGRDVILKSDPKKPSADDAYWKLQNKNGNVTFYNNEKNIVDVNGVSLTKDASLKALKNIVIGSVDRMSGGIDLDGDYAVWCLDTETTGIFDSEHLVNIGASAYSVVKNSGQVVQASDIYRTVNGEVYMASHFDSVPIDELAAIDPSRIIVENGSTEMLVTDGFANVLPLSATLVDNIAFVGDGTAIVNRKIKQKYISGLVKDYSGDGLNEIAMKISGISNEQIDKYGLSISQVTELMNREAGEFKKNCFIAHNSDFDTNVLANHSIKMAELLTEGGNFVADTLRVAKNNDMLLASKDVLSINYGSRTAEINANQKADVIEFLKNGQLGDSIQCAVGKLEFAETRGKVKLRVFDNKGGIFHKDFDVENRDPKFIENMFVSKTVHTYPSLKLSSYSYMNFENDALLKSFISSGKSGEKLRGINGYLEVYDGGVYAYPKGLETAPKKICDVSDKSISVVVQRELSSLGNNMERLISVNKAVALLDTIENKLMSNERLMELVDTDQDKYSLLQSYQLLYDFSKTSNQNIKNFLEANSDLTIESLPELQVLDTELRNNNKVKIGCFKQNDMFIAAAKACDEMIKISDDGLAERGAELGIPHRMMKVAAKCVLDTKRNNKLKGLVFDKQSHCNASRSNSDACVELPVFASVANRFSRNHFDVQSKDQFLVNELSKTSVPATQQAVEAKSDRKVITRANEQTVGFRNIGGALGKLGLVGGSVVQKISRSAETHNIGVEVDKNFRFGFTIKESSRFREFSRKLISFVKTGGISGGKNVNKLDGIRALISSKMDSLGMKSMHFVADIDKNIRLIKDNILSVVHHEDASLLNLDHDNSGGLSATEINNLYKEQINSARSAIAIMSPEDKASIGDGLDEMESTVLERLVVMDKKLMAVDLIDDTLSTDFGLTLKENDKDRMNLAKLSAQAAMAECGDNWLVGSRNTLSAKINDNEFKRSKIA
ncbi:hypothetical protein [Photobacterium damselae]|uniref:hypothetical protein n=1 Tax=Photobacterium damselae TaxID=38293 RepID=UPI00406834E6